MLVRWQGRWAGCRLGRGGLGGASELRDHGMGAGEAGYPRAAHRGGTPESTQRWRPALGGQKPGFAALSLPKESLSPPWRTSSYPRELGDRTAGKGWEETALPGRIPRCRGTLTSQGAWLCFEVLVWSC